MVRQRIYDEPMTPAERRRKSDADRLARGEQRITVWLNPEASAIIDELAGPKSERADLAALVSEAIIFYKRKKK